MKIKTFRNVRFDGDWEIDLMGHRWQFRIGRSQVAFWTDVGRDPLFCWLAPRARSASVTDAEA